MNDRSIFAYIPPNIGDSGGIAGGITSVRKLVEAGVAGLLALGLYALLQMFLPIKVAIYISAVIGIIFAGICVFGLGGEPFSVFIANCINYENRRNFVTLRPPIPEYLLKGEADDE